jgi:hypothetical protein
MKWIKLFENFDYNSFDLYTDLTMTQFRELVKERQRFKPTESDLYEIENIIKKNSKREVISTELGWKTTHDQYWLFKTATREIESEETSHFLFYSISMNSRHKLSGLAEDYIYIVKTTDNFYLIVLYVVQNIPDRVNRETTENVPYVQSGKREFVVYFFICDDLDGLHEFVKKELN